MSRLWRVAPLLIISVFGTGFLMGDDKKEPIVVSVRLPAHYSRLGLTPKQRSEIYKIRGKVAAEIQELYQKISDLRDQEKKDCEKVLTAAQRTRLRELLGGPSDTKVADDEDAPAKADKKKSVEAKDKKKDAKAKEKTAPGELNKPVEIKK